MRPIRVYADTSVYGGVFDAKFDDGSKAFFKEVKTGRFELVASTLVKDELIEAPQRVRRFFQEMTTAIDVEEVLEEATDLQIAYLAAGVVGEGSVADALHVAMATILGCHVIVSWNFKHIVHFQKIPLYNGVNLLQGYGEIAIHTPDEVISYER
jgi:hypothetical protein